MRRGRSARAGEPGSPDPHWRKRTDDVDTPLQWFLDSSAYDAAHAADPVRLKLMAHGAPAYVQFCHENLFTTTLPQLGVLKDKFTAGVDLYACSVAFIGPGDGDGNVFCYTMAKTLNTCVRAGVPLGTSVDDEETGWRCRGRSAGGRWGRPWASPRRSG